VEADRAVRPTSIQVLKSLPVLIRIILTIYAGALLAPASLFAQWPSRPTPGAPRITDGKVDLSGPVRRTADGKPDLSGVWDRGVARLDDGPKGIAPSGPPPIGVSGAPQPPGPRPFQDLPSAVPGGLPMLPWAAEYRKQRLTSNSKEHPDAHCLPLNPVQLHSHPQPRKIVQMPGLLMIVYEANGGLRQIFTDGRPLPGSDAEPWWYGYSIGKWEGDTLVVETTGFRDDQWLDEEGTPMTSSGRVTERFRRPNYGTLEIDISVDDPKTFTKPWTVKLQQRLLPDTELIEFVCLENEKSVRHMVGK
jgi:hypothetical protein